jgi:hypothetical protein
MLSSGKTGEVVPIMGQPVEKSGSGLARDLVTGIVPIEGQDFVVIVRLSC